ncbi:hypothetical protein AVEN_231947-1 [Araneus ventricosus]|uniref:Uncharacterized protein n=1 Tax=Araneus ventricosus TaxID=182803 RepID=A0A4Y2C047_ARAVE|nr:hypothetical protein AVEN_231947-1 [Araneus ventricosus]
MLHFAWMFLISLKPLLHRQSKLLFREKSGNFYRSISIVLRDQECEPTAKCHQMSLSFYEHQAVQKQYRDRDGWVTSKQFNNNRPSKSSTMLNELINYCT